MKQVILDVAVTLAGFIEGPDGEIDWCIMDDDMDFGGHRCQPGRADDMERNTFKE